MKRYLLFSGHHHEASIGMHSFCDDYETLKEAKKAYKKMIPKKGEKFRQYYWGQVFDTETRTIVYRHNYYDTDDREKF